MAEQRPIGDQVVELLVEAQLARDRLFRAQRDAREATGHYGYTFPRLVGAAMLRYQTRRELPGRESVLDMVRAGAGWLLSSAEGFALEQACEQVGDYEAEVAAAVGELLGDTEVTATPRQGQQGFKVYHKVRVHGGTEGGLGMPNDPITGTYVGLDLGMGDARLHLASPDLGPDYAHWAVTVATERGRQLVDLSVQPIPAA